MGQPMTDTQVSETRPTPRALIVAATIALVLVAATAALWLHYGTAVFYETIVAGIAACL